MGDFYSNALIYGHMGTASYSTETQSWHFSRRPASTRPSFISYTGVTSRTIRPSARRQSGDLAQPRELSTAQFRAFPELTATSSTAQAEGLSRAITAATARWDPQISSLLEFGYAAQPYRHRAAHEKVVPIAAVASGEGRNTLTLARLETEIVEVVEGLPVMIPYIGNQEVVNWTGTAAPIRQIRSSRPVDDVSFAEFIAVRYERSTFILQPYHHSEAQPVRTRGTPYDEDWMLPTQDARLDPNPLLEIRASQTGGFAHVDVAFNPWYQRQFGIVDARGNWSLWSIADRDSQEDLVVHVQSGSLVGPDDEMYDGWGALEWVGGASSLVVANRTRMILYTQASEGGPSFPVDLGLRRETDWILDVKRCPIQPSRLFVLTTSSIARIDLDLDSLQEDSISSIRPRLLWRHFRDPEDLTLRLIPITVGDYLYLVLYSRFNRLGLGFEFPPPTMDTLEPAVSDPFDVMLPEATASGRQNLQYLTIVVREVEQHVPARGPQHTPSSRLLKMFIVDDMLAVREHLFSAPLDEDDGFSYAGITGRGMLRLWKRSTASARIKGPEQVAVYESDDSSGNAREGPADSTSARSKSKPLRKGLDLTLVYKIIVKDKEPFLAPKKKNINKAKIVNLKRGFRDCMEELSGLVLESDNQRFDRAKTALEICNCAPVSDDIDESAQDLEQLKTELADASSATQLLYIPMPYTDKGPMRLTSVEQDADLLALYDQMVHDWLSVLPDTIADQTRVFKEKLIRNIAIELCLARMLHVRSLPLDPPSSSVEGPLFSSQSLPSQPVSQPQRLATTLDLSLSSSPNPLHNPITNTATLNLNTLTTSSKVPSSFFSSSINTLRRGNSDTTNTNNNNNNKPSVTAEGVINDILSHWTLGRDPATYSWSRTVQAREEEQRRAAASSQHKKRKRERERERGLSDDHRLVRTSPVIPIVRGGGFSTQLQQQQSDGGMLGSEGMMVGSSQISEEMLPMPMTQIECGAYGSRDVTMMRRIGGNHKDKAKKKRTAGF